MTATVATIPGYVTGTWDIDPVHSDVSFTVKHLMLSKVRGHFDRFSGEIVTGELPEDSSVTATIELDSVNTGNEMRDGDIRSENFLDVQHHPSMSYRSTAVRRDGDGYVIDGELTLHGVTRAVPLALEFNGFGPDPYGGFRSGYTATGTVNRSEFGVDINMPMDGGGVVVSDKIQLRIEIEAVLRQA